MLTTILIGRLYFQDLFKDTMFEKKSFNYKECMVIIRCLYINGRKYTHTTALILLIYCRALL